MWDLTSSMRDGTHVPCIGRWIFNQQTTQGSPLAVLTVLRTCGIALSDRLSLRMGDRGVESNALKLSQTRFLGKKILFHTENIE